MTSMKIMMIMVMGVVLMMIESYVSVYTYMAYKQECIAMHRCVCVHKAGSYPIISSVSASNKSAETAYALDEFACAKELLL